jgi:hypothetical protein
MRSEHYGNFSVANSAMSVELGPSRFPQLTPQLAYMVAFARPYFVNPDLVVHRRPAPLHYQRSC